MSDELKKTADDVIKTMEKRLNGTKAATANWGKTIAIVFPDIETGYTMKFAMDGSVEKIEKKPASEIKTGGDVLTSVIGNVQDQKDCVDGQWSPRELFSIGTLKVEGSFESLPRIMSCYPSG